MFVCRAPVVRVVTGGALVVLAGCAGTGSGTTERVRLDNLMRAPLGGAPGTEVIVSRVSIPPNTSLPKHWHPGEEFAYVIDGSVTLWQEGKEDVVGSEGDVVKVPLKQVHTALTGNDGVELLVFRVHESGKPERVPVK